MSALARRAPGAAQSLAAHRGNVAERFVEDQHKALAAAGIAFLYRVPTPIVVTGRHASGGVIARYAARATVDYLGHLADGTACAVECKRITPKPLASGVAGAPSLPYSQVEPHQRDALNRCDDAGGLAIVLVVLESGGLFAVPWRHVRRAVPAPRSSLRGEALERFRVRPGRLYLPLSPSVPGVAPVARPARLRGA
jgi:penicillin-binding protein-related factor A (putative recombinase)